MARFSYATRRTGSFVNSGTRSSEGLVGAGETPKVAVNQCRESAECGVCGVEESLYK
jgi:hypothetical protein